METCRTFHYIHKGFGTNPSLKEKEESITTFFEHCKRLDFSFQVWQHVHIWKINSIFLWKKEGNLYSFCWTGIQVTPDLKSVKWTEESRLPELITVSLRNQKLSMLRHSRSVWINSKSRDDVPKWVSKHWDIQSTEAKRPHLLAHLWTQTVDALFS